MVVYCGVKGCKRNARNDKDHTFFRIPGNPGIRKKWLEFADLTEGGRHLYICIDHFEEKCIWKRHPRCLLTKNSVPTIKSVGRVQGERPVFNQHSATESSASVVENMVIDEQKENQNQMLNESNAGLDMEVTHETLKGPNVLSPSQHEQAATQRAFSCNDSQGSAINITPKTLRINTQRRTISALRSKIYRLKHQDNPVKRKKKLTQQKLESLIQDSSLYSTKEAQILFETQLRLAGLNKYGKRYSDKIKDIALSILYHSPKAYRYLKKFLNLPSERTLRNYQSKFPIYPGLSLSVLDTLKARFKNASISDRVVSLVIDEVSLTPEVHYDPHSDKFLGYADDGVERQPQIARSAAVVMLTWINKNVKQVIGYYLLGSTGNTSKMHQLISESIDRVYEQGLIVKSVIFDQGPRNQGFLSQEGVTVQRPYFYRNGEKIYVIYDPPHLLKSIRNNLLTKKLKYKNGIVDWQEIHKVFQLSSTNPLNLLPRISKKHFKLGRWSKMRVCLAAQILSESMYTAHLVYKTIFPEKFGVDCVTSQFIIDMDKLFDTLNSSLLKKNIPQKLNYAISNDSEHTEFLKSMLINFKEAKFEKVQPACIKGFQLTINAVLHLFEDLSSNYEITHLCTRRLNQDPLENLFATVRQQHGCSMYPSPMQFESGIRHILITHLTKVSDSSNCQADTDHIFAKLSDIENIRPENTSNESSSLICFSNVDLVDSAPESEVQEFTESNAVYYICGYLCKKFLSHHDCVDCKRLLIHENDSHYAEHKLFTIMKTYADTHGLVHVKEDIFKKILAWERMYKSVIKSIVHSNNITQVIKHIITESCSNLDLCSADSTQAFLKLFLRIRCHWEARFLRREISESEKKAENKPTLESKKMRKFVATKV